jgi:Shedu protein SduA, C-terminal
MLERGFPVVPPCWLSQRAPAGIGAARPAPPRADMIMKISPRSTAIIPSRRPMERSDLENAISVLANLVKQEELPEDEFQRFFENNPIVCEIMGYERTYPKPVLPLSNGESLVPDFLGRRPNGLYEIIDIKTPQERLIYTKKHRTEFNAKMNQYIRQVLTYSKYFDDQQNRQLVLGAYGFDIQKRPDTLIIAGKDSYVDKRQLHELTRDRAIALQIATYDDVLSNLLFHHARLYGYADNLPGASFYAIVTLRRQEQRRRKYILDYGATIGQNRWSVVVDENNRLTFEVIDSHGDSHSVSTRRFQFDKMIHLACEFGSSDAFALLQIRINGGIVAKLELPSPVSVPSDSGPYDSGSSEVRSDSLRSGFRGTIGANMNGTNNGAFDMAGLAVYNIVLPFRQRIAVANAIVDEFFSSSDASEASTRDKL